MQTKIIERYFFFILLFIAFIASIVVLSPFWVVLVLGISFSIVLYPIFRWLNKKLPNWLASLLTVILFVLIIAIPLFGIGVVVFNQSQHAYQTIIGNVDSSAFIDSINTSINRILPAGFSFDLYEKISNFITYITDNLAGLFTSTLSTIFSIFFTLMSIFYFLKDGARWKESLMSLSPLSKTDNEKIMDRFSMSVNGILKGYLLIAIIQATLMGTGLTLFGVPNPALWGLITLITAFIPTIGTGLVSIPAIIFLLLTGETFNAVGLLVWSVGIVATIDNLLSPVIVGNRIQLPPLLILFSVLGGIALMGAMGILIGPLIISFLYTLISIYREEFRQSNENA